MEEKKTVKLKIDEYELELILDALDLYYGSTKEVIKNFQKAESLTKEEYSLYATGLSVAMMLQCLIEKTVSVKKLMELAKGEKENDSK